jgi:hypothetical protein
VFGAALESSVKDRLTSDCLPEQVLSHCADWASVMVITGWV